MAATGTLLFGEGEVAEPIVGKVGGLYFVGIVDAGDERSEAIGMDVLNGDVMDVLKSGAMNIDKTNSATAFDVAHGDTSDGGDGVFA